MKFMRMCPTDNLSEWDTRTMERHIPTFIIAPGWAFCRQTGGLIAPGERVLVVWDGRRKYIYSSSSRLYQAIERERKTTSNDKSKRHHE